MSNKQSPEVIHAYGVWILRIALAVGAIVAGLMGNDTVTGGCISGLIMTFFFL